MPRKNLLKDVGYNGERLPLKENFEYLADEIDNVESNLQTQINNKASSTSVNQKADKTYVDTQIVNLQNQINVKENTSNKATDLDSPNNTKYPTTKAVSDALALKVDKSEFNAEITNRQNADVNLQNQINIIKGAGHTGQTIKGNYDLIQALGLQINQLTDKPPVSNVSDLATVYREPKVGYHVFVEGINNINERGWYTYLNGLNRINNGINNANWSVTGTGSVVNPTSVKIVSTTGEDGTATLSTTLETSTQYKIKYKIIESNIPAGSLYIDTDLVSEPVVLSVLEGEHEVTITTKSSITNNRLRLVLNNGYVNNVDVTFQILSIFKVNDMGWYADINLVPLASSIVNGLLSKEDYPQVKKIPTIENTLNNHINSISAHGSSSINNQSGVIGAKVTDALNTLKGQIESTVAGTTNVTIGVYSVSDITNTNNYVASISGVTYFGGLKINLTVSKPNTGTSTLNINNLGAKSIKVIGQDGVKYDVIGGQISGTVQLQYDGIDFILIGESVPVHFSDSFTAQIHSLPETVEKGQLSVTVKGLTATNLVKNGNFVKDSDGDEIADFWKAGGSNFTNPRIENNIQYWMPLLSKVYSSSLGTEIYIPNIRGHKYYIKAKTKNVGQVYWWGETEQGISITGIPATGLIFTSNRQGITRLVFYASEANVESYVSNVIIVDLTAHGLEDKTVDELDAMFSHYFDDTKSTISALRLTSQDENEENQSYMYVKAVDEEGNILPMRSLPNNVQDELYADNGQYKFKQNIGVKNDVPQDTVIDYADMATGGQFVAYAADGTTQVGVKGDILTIDAVSLNYQLATPVVTNATVVGHLDSYPNGTIIVEPIVADFDFYDEEEGIIIKDINVPIKRLDKVIWTDKETGIEVDITDTCTVSQDGLSFTSTYAIDGDLIWYEYEYDSSMTTLPTVSFKAPLNSKAVIKDLVKAKGELQKKTDNLDLRVQGLSKRVDNVDLRVKVNAELLKSSQSLQLLNTGDRLKLMFNSHLYFNDEGVLIYDEDVVGDVIIKINDDGRPYAVKLKGGI